MKFYFFFNLGAFELFQTLCIKQELFYIVVFQVYVIQFNIKFIITDLP